MSEREKSESTSSFPSRKEQLRRAARVLRNQRASDKERGEALTTLRSLGNRARAALLFIVAALNDTEEDNRHQAFDMFADLCSVSTEQIRTFARAFASADEKDRLDALCQVVRIVPEVQEARATRAPGWRLLREMIRRAHPAKEGPMPQSRRNETALRELDDATFYELLPTKTRDPHDPVVRVMRENPGRWVAWNEATRDVYAITDDYNEALQAIVNPDDPEVQLDMAPGFHPDAPIHRPLELLPWESPNVLDDVQLLWGNSADAWLDAPNPRFGNRKPRELVNTDEEDFLREVLRAVRYGATS